MRTFKILTEETVTTEREYFVDAEDLTSAKAIFVNALNAGTQNEYLNDEGCPFSKGEEMAVIIETDNDGNALTVL
jgi:hypothetical protein